MKSPKIKQRLLISLLSILIPLTAVSLLYSCKKDEPKKPRTEIIYDSFKLKRGDMRVIVRAPGRIVPAAQVAVKSKVGGTVDKVHVELGAEVTKEQLLIELDSEQAAREVRLQQALLDYETVRLEKSKQKSTRISSEYQTKLAEALAQVNSSEPRVEEAQDAHKKVLKLFELKQAKAEKVDAAEKNLTNAMSELAKAQQDLAQLKKESFDVDLAAKEVDEAQARVDEQKIKLEQSEAAQSEMRILAPIEGIVTENNIQPGQIVASGLTDGGSQALMVVSDLTHIYLDAQVDEEKISLVSQNLAAKIRARALTGKEYQGRVVRIAPVGTTMEYGVKFDVRIEIDDKGRDEIRPGMTGEAVMIAKEKADVLLIPREAVDDKAIAEDGQTDIARLNKFSKKETITIRVGLFDGDYYEVLEGLRAGDKVISRTPRRVVSSGLK